MSGPRWRLSALEFAVAFAQAGYDRLPYPFASRSTAAAADEYAALWREAEAHLAARRDDQLAEVIGALAEADVRIEVYGLHDREKPMVVRVLAARRGSIGVVGVQFPGRTHDDGSDVLLALCDPHRLVQRTVELLPPQRAGRMAGIAISRHRLEQRGDEPMWQDADPNPYEREARRFFDRPRNSFGEIMVATGFGLEERHDGVRWMDFDGDGRYLVRDDEMLGATPAGPDEIARALTSLVDAALRRQGAW